MGVSDVRRLGTSGGAGTSARHGRGLSRVGLLAVIFLGGALGTFVRAALQDAFPVRTGAVPWVVLAINLAGALVLGLLLEALARSGADVGWRRTVRLAVGTGVLGGFTTYSTLAVESAQGLAGGSLLVGVAYPLASIVLGVALAMMGQRLAHALRPHAPGSRG